MQNFDLSHVPNILKKKGSVVVPEAISFTHCEKGEATMVPVRIKILA